MPRSSSPARYALAGIVQPVWMLGGAFLLGATRPGYEPLRDAISELGEVGAATSLAWNVGGFGVAAVLYALYAVAVRRAFGKGWLFRLVALQSILIAGSGLFRCDPGCPTVPQSPTMWAHTIVGLAYFAITTLLPLVAWRVFRRRDEWRSFAHPSLAVGSVLVALFFIGPTLGEDRIGAWQRSVLLLAYAWQAAVAIRLYALLEGRATAEMASPSRLT